MAIGATSLTVSMAVATADVAPSLSVAVTLIVKFETGIPGILFRYLWATLKAPLVILLTV